MYYKKKQEEASTEDYNKFGKEINVRELNTQLLNELLKDSNQFSTEFTIKLTLTNTKL